MGWGGGRSWVSRMRTPAPPPRPAEDGLLRCKQLTVLLDWAEQFEAESRQSDEAVAFSVLLGDLNFDNCSLGKTARSPPPHTHTLRARAHTHTHTLTYTHTPRMSPLHRPPTGTGAPVFQLLPGPLPAGHAPGAALGPGYAGAGQPDGGGRTSGGLRGDAH